MCCKTWHYQNARIPLLVLAHTLSVLSPSLVAANGLRMEEHNAHIWHWNSSEDEIWTVWALNSEVHAHFVFAWDGWFRFPCASESTKCVVLWDIWPWKRGGGWNGMVCILLGSMTRWFLFLARAGLRCMMAVATAAPAKDVCKQMQSLCFVSALCTAESSAYLP